jgi:hypothetical protein
MLFLISCTKETKQIPFKCIAIGKTLCFICILVKNGLVTRFSKSSVDHLMIEMSLELFIFRLNANLQ